MIKIFIFYDKGGISNPDSPNAKHDLWLRCENSFKMTNVAGQTAKGYMFMGTDPEDEDIILIANEEFIIKPILQVIKFSLSDGTTTYTTNPDPNESKTYPHGQQLIPVDIYRDLGGLITQYRSDISDEIITEQMFSTGALSIHLMSSGTSENLFFRGYIRLQYTDI